MGSSTVAADDATYEREKNVEKRAARNQSNSERAKAQAQSLFLRTSYGGFRYTVCAPREGSAMKIVIVGGGICGLGASLLLARDHHDVTLLERDGSPLPESPQAAWELWERKGVAQFRQPHNFMPGLRLLLEAELPDLQDAFRQHGATKYDLVNPLPALFSDRSTRPIDEKLWTLTARRPLGEWVFAQAAARQRGLTIDRGVQVKELLTGPAVLPGVPHVAGVKTADGREFDADLVIDATGRQSQSIAWLAAIGARPPHQEQADCGFTYYTRYFSGKIPQRLAPTLSHLGTISILTLPGDNDTWSVTIFTASGDHELKRLRHEEPWMKTIRACPIHSHWLEGKAISEVLPMGGIVDRYRRFLVEAKPISTGFVAIADAWACTNPSAGRGLTIGMLHALLLRDVLRTAGENHASLVHDFDRRTEEEMTPWYRAQLARDRARFAEMEALREGRKPGPLSDDLARDIESLFLTMIADPDLFRLAMEYLGTITSIQRILERPGVRETIRKAREGLKDAPVRIPGPNRQQLLELLA